MKQSFIKVERLVSPTEDQIDAIVAMAVKAFAGDISHKALLGGNWDLHGQFFYAMTRASALEGKIYVVKDHNTGDILSCGMWFAPGTSLFGTDEQRTLGYNAFFEKLSPETQYWWTNTYPQTMNKFQSELFTEEELQKRWWCFHLATDPKHYNQGYASAIVNFVFEEVQSLDQFLGLATSPEINVRKYLAMGFYERGQTYLEAPTGGFLVHVLSRS